jgi:hypothetical protein
MPTLQERRPRSVQESSAALSANVKTVGFQEYSECFRTPSGLPGTDLRIVTCGWNKTSVNEGYRMTADSTVRPLAKGNALLAIAAGGLIAGTLDLLQACILFGLRVPLTIVGGLLGPAASHGGAGTYVLGVVLHYFIATSATAIYYGASRRLLFLTEHPLVCGLFFGMAVELVMGYIVLPLSALHDTGPYELRDVLQGLGVHMVVVGLPIAYSIRRFAK